MKENTHNLSDFLRRVHTQVHPDLDFLQKNREARIAKFNRNRWWYFGGASAISAIILALVTKDENLGANAYLILIGITAFWALIIFVAGNYSIQAAYKKPLKNVLLDALVKEFGSDWVFDTNSTISKSTFLESQLYSRGSVDRYRGEDLFRGTHNKVNFAFSEVHAERRTKDKDGKTKYSTTFRGLYMVADLNRPTQNRTFILPDYSEKWLGQWLTRSMQKITLGKGQLVQLENPAFEKLFKVLADDQIEARILLTPRVMEDLVDFKNRNPEHIAISLINGHLYIALSLNKNLFEVSIKESLTDKKYLDELATDVFYCLDILEELTTNWNNN